MLPEVLPCHGLEDRVYAHGNANRAVPILLLLGDWQEPRHIHVERDDAKAKFWLDPVRLERSTGFGSAELNKIQRLVDEHVAEMRRRWDEYFGR